MNKLVTSLIRTYSPLVVGALTEWYTALPEIAELDEYPGAVSTVVAALYYFFPRLAEHLGYKNAGLFLGVRKEPNYGSAEDSIIAAHDAELPWSD